AGDTIDSIAVAYGLTRDQLLALNPLANPRIIQIGQQLTVRAATGEAQTTTEAETSVEFGGTVAGAATSIPQVAAVNTPVSTPEGPLLYYVQAGDTVDSIAFTNGLTRDQLMALNNMTDPRIIQIGQQLILRAAPESTAEVGASPEETD